MAATFTWTKKSSSTWALQAPNGVIAAVVTRNPSDHPLTPKFKATVMGEARNHSSVAKYGCNHWQLAKTVQSAKRDIVAWIAWHSWETVEVAGPPMFNPTIAKTQLIDALNKIKFGQFGIIAGRTTLELRASGIELACELFANFIEEMAADADASISSGKIDETVAHAIADAGGDLSGMIYEAAERIAEMA